MNAAEIQLYMLKGDAAPWMALVGQRLDPCPAGDMDMDPVTGQYRFTCSVPCVEVNELRKTLGIRPPPLPVGGALHGVLHCTGPLEQPVFSGAAPVQSLFLQQTECQRSGEN